MRESNCLPFTSTWVYPHPQFLVGSVMLTWVYPQFSVGSVTWVYPQFLVGSVMLIFSVFCVVFVLVLCLVSSMSPVSLDSPFLIASSIFSNVYLNSDDQQFHSPIATKRKCSAHLTLLNTSPLPSLGTNVAG